MTDQAKPTLVSPNDMQEAGIDIMLDGRQPKTEEDWLRLCNFWACNSHHGVEESICKLMALMFDAPIRDDQIVYIAQMQAELKEPTS